MFDSILNRLGRGRLAAIVVAAFVILCNAGEVFACSVCQGNPDSKLVKGAEAGVLFMVIVTYVLLLGMAALVASWFIRQNRRLRRVQLEGGAAGFEDGSNSEPPRS